MLHPTRRPFVRAPRNPVQALGARPSLAAVVAVCAWVASCGGDEFAGAPPAPDAAAQGGGAGSAGAGLGGQAGNAGQPGSGGAQAGAAGAAGDAGPDAPVELLHGKVVDPYLQPLQGVKVRVGGANALSGADGTFEVAVPETSPYDVLIVSEQGGRKYGYAFVGLERKDPLLQLPSHPAVTPMSAKVNGAMAWPVVEATDGLVWTELGGAEAGGKNSETYVSANKSYSLEAKWYGPSPAKGTLHALQWEKQADSLPKQFKSWQSQPISLSNGATSTQAVAPAANTLSNGTLSVEVSVPNPSFVVGSKSVYLQVDEANAWPRFINDGTPLGDVSYTVPVLPGAQYAACGMIKPSGSLSLVNYSVGCRRGLQPGGSASISPPLPPVTLTPANNATGVDTATDFTWTDFGSGVYVMSVYVLFGSSVSVITTSKQARLPDLSALGFPLSGGAYYYSVTAVEPVGSMDEATGPEGFLVGVTDYGDLRGPRMDGSAGVSDVVTIMTK